MPDCGKVTVETSVIELEADPCDRTKRDAGPLCLECGHKHWHWHAAGLSHVEADIRIDLLLRDVGLPDGADGRQLANAAIVRHPGPKVQFITGFAGSAAVGDGVMEPGMELMADEALAMDALAARIEDMISG